MKALLLFLALLVVPFIAIDMNDNAAHAEEITIDVPFKVAEQENGQTACTLYFDPDDSRIQVMRCYFTSLVMDETYQPATLIPAAVQPVSVVKKELISL